MKITKVKLIKAVQISLEKMGYTKFVDSIEGTQGLFIKRLNNGLYLSLGLTISRYYKNMFTADYYLSKNTRWGAVWGDIPNEIFERPGKFLKKQERLLYLDKEHNVDGVIDVWWDGSDEKEINNFLKVIELTEQRFINQPEIIKKIEESTEIFKLLILANITKELVNLNLIESVLKFQPQNEIDNIPLEWFKSAEKVLKENKEILNKNTVKFLAADAWRQFVLEQTLKGNG
jgi:hypothetical protein